MARAKFVKKARKDYPDFGIKKGDSYYWWSFRFGGKYKSKTAPKRSQLTQSEFLSELYSIEEAIEDAKADEGLEVIRDEVVDRLRTLGEECADRLSNMPEGLQYGSTGELLQERADRCEDGASELEGIDLEFEPDEDNPDAEDEFWTNALDELQGVDLDIE